MSDRLKRFLDAVAREPSPYGPLAQHTSPWHWQVPSFLVAKAIGSGVFMLLAVLFGLGYVEYDRPLAIAGSFMSLLFMGLTTGLLMLDPDRPGRSLAILTRPHWQSWLTRGEFILVGFSTVVGLWLLVESGAALGIVTGGLADVVRPYLLVIGLPLAVLSAAYGAFVFGAAEGRRLWQRALLPVHMLVQAVIAGSMVLAVVMVVAGIPFRSGTSPVEIVMEFGIVVVFADLLILVFGKGLMPDTGETTAHAGKVTRRGKYRRRYWWGVVGCGHVLPLFAILAYNALEWLPRSGIRFEGPNAWSVEWFAWFILLDIALIFITPFAVLIGLYLYLDECAFVMASQDVPNRMNERLKPFPDAMAELGGDGAGEPSPSGTLDRYRAPRDWQVPAYLVAKAIGSGVFMHLAVLFGVGYFRFDRTLAIAGSFTTLLFIGVTIALLVLDTERPERLPTILNRPQGKSWLTRDAFVLVGFSLVVGVWFLAEVGVALGMVPDELAAVVRPYLLALGFALAVLAAVLFRQVEGRDLWQSWLQPLHMLVQALMAGAVVLACLVIASDVQYPEAGYPFQFALVMVIVDLVILVFGEILVRHKGETAVRAGHEMRHGKYRRRFWRGAVGFGHVLPIVAVFVYIAAGRLLGAIFRAVDDWPFVWQDYWWQIAFFYTALTLMAIAPFAILIGLYYYEYAFVMARQEAPNS